MAGLKNISNYDIVRITIKNKTIRTMTTAIHPKTPEYLYAQTAAFVGHIPELSRRIGETASSLLSGADVTFGDRQLDGSTTERTVTSLDYVNFLRSADQETRADIGFLSEKMQAFPTFAANADAAISKGENSENYLGRGSNGMAFAFDQGGERHVVGRLDWRRPCFPARRTY